MPLLRRSPSHEKSRKPQPSRPTVPTVPTPPLSARAASLGLLFLAGYAVLLTITGLDLLLRLLTPLLSTGSLPTWAFTGFVASAIGSSGGLLLLRRFAVAARMVADQDRRASVRFAIPFALAVAVHATLVAGPLNRWGQAAPVIGSFVLGNFAILLVPFVVLAAMIATIGRSRANAWLNSLPD